PLLNFRDRTELNERLHDFALGYADSVHVRLDQTWHDGLPVCIDDTRAVTDQLLDISVCADRDEAVAADGDCFNDRKPRIDGHNVDIHHNQIGARLSPSHNLAGEDKAQDQSIGPG